jgi:hypothetical protein
VLLRPLSVAAQPAPGSPQNLPAASAQPAASAPGESAPLPPASALPDTPPPSDAPPPPETPPPPEPPKTIDVSVGGEKGPAGSSTLRRRDIREIPGVLADPYRSIEVKPGVMPTVSGLPYFFIRGAPPANIGYFFDGVQVPLLFHVGGGPSVVPATLVQKVTFHPGPYPASYGRFAGAVIDATSTPPPLEWKGEVGLRLDVGAVVQGPVNDKIDVLAGAHYAYAGALVSALVPSVQVGYGDYQLRVVDRPGPGQRAQLLLFGAGDKLALIGDGGVKTTLLDTDFHRADLRYEKDLEKGGRATVGVTLGFDVSRNVGVKEAQDQKLAARALLEKPILDGRATLRAGVDASLDAFRITQCKEEEAVDRCAPGDDPAGRADFVETFRKLFPSRLDFTMGAYIESEFRFGERSTIVPGLRIDYYHSLGDSDVAIDPKLAARLALNDYVALVPAIGVASQRPGFAPLPALVIGGIPGGLQRSLQTSFGAEARFGPFEAVAAVFRQATFGLTDAIGTGRGTDLDEGRFLNRTTGDTYGIEIGAQGPLRRDMFLLVSYTLSRATRRGADGRTLPSAYDRTHIAQAALLFDFGGGWRGGFRHVFYSGFPADEVGPGHEPLEDPPRVKPFYRLDARLSKRWAITQKRWVSLVFDVQNATLSKEVFDVTCTSRGCTPISIGPVSIPALALEAGF